MTEKDRAADTAVCLIARDKFSEAPAALAAVYADLPARTSVTIVDCGYPPELLDRMVRSAPAPLPPPRVVSCPRFANTNTAWNAFVASTTASVLICVENDVSVRPGCLPGLVEGLADGRFDVVTPVIHQGRLGDVHFDPPVSELVDQPDGALLSRLVRRPKPDHPRVPGTRSIAHVEKHCYAMTRAAAQRLGELDELMHCRTDLELSLSCRSAGLRIGILPALDAVFRKEPTVPDDVEVFTHRWNVERAGAANDRLVKKWRLTRYKSSVEFVGEMLELLER
ncbi:hypothetical protein [Streptomyces sp. Agncl-13]|uniref:hypothetical protein n=1 Tax=Streptomyces sp. Agncl-13 TaxID=3400628 RepID=UPI003A8A6D91